MGGTEGLRASPLGLLPHPATLAAARAALVTAICLLAFPLWRVERLTPGASEVVILGDRGGFMAHRDRNALLGINPLCWIKMPYIGPYVISFVKS